VIFVDGAYLQNHDVLRGDRPHRYDLRYHNAQPHVGFTLHVKGARGLSLEDGWISSRYGERRAAPVVSAVTVGESARFVTLLAPDTRVLELLDDTTARVGDDTIVLGERVTRR
jgi:hypothetical protein